MENKLDSLIRDTIHPYSLTPLIGEMINFILSGICESLVLVNKDGEIEFMDRHTEKFFNLMRGGAKGLHVTKLVPDTRLHLIAKTGLKEIGKLLEVKGQKKIVTRFPIKKNGQIIGAIGKIIFYKLQEIESLNKEISELRLRIDHYRKGFKEFNLAQYNFEQLLGNSEKFVTAKQLAIRAALTDADILIIGESGTGKELFSHSIHNVSNRKRKPFIRVNCPSIPFDLAESELFGYEKGAFSGARNEGKPGKFELCEGGTIFLDEVGSLPLSIQAKLLRVLQEKEIERLGGKNSIKVDFRVISATNVNLSELIEKGRFRSDLFYRLNTIPIEIPPLRERKEDIPLYIDHFLKKINISFGSNARGISDDGLKIIMNYHWPGNLRELMNVLEQSILNMAGGDIILPMNLPQILFEKNYNVNVNNFSLKNIVERSEIETIRKVLNSVEGNKRKAAKLLNIQRSVLYQKLKRYHINYPP
jgi:transcriptional regulator with PAS, ATPase and Fis domain